MTRVLDVLDRARGCLMGLFVGDAAGAPLEFLRSRDPAVIREAVAGAMRMEGGGSLNVAPGQFTDDSELAIHLLLALRGEDPDHGFPRRAVAREYIKWHHSDPFDRGQTCSRAFGFADGATTMTQNAQSHNMLSEANGSLMRVAPLAVWARSVPPETLIAYARDEATLSHPNVVCRDANAMFCLALASLIRDGSAASAIERVDAHASDMCPEVRDWYARTSGLSVDRIECKTNAGHVMHAFTLAFAFLRLGTPFQEGIRATIEKLGDTDTNAAIVGAMLGALHGHDAIPEAMRRAVLDFDCASHDPRRPGAGLLGFRRPATYRAKDAMQALDEVVRTPSHIIPEDTPASHPTHPTLDADTPNT